jgi:PTH1 family peptidyl-tRNA hydrolase
MVVTMAQSVIEHLGSQQFPRLRIGIGLPARGSTVPYVLSDFFTHERTQLPGVIDCAVEAVHDWLDRASTPR